MTDLDATEVASAGSCLHVEMNLTFYFARNDDGGDGTARSCECSLKDDHHWCINTMKM